MFFSRNLAAQAAVAGALMLASHSVFAGQAAGIIMHEPFATPVPAIGGVGLVALALLLSVVAVRLFKRAGGSKFLITAIGAAALASGSGGVKLIGDAHATLFPNINLTVDAGGTVDIPISSGCYEVINTTAVQQRITLVDAAPGWVLQPCLMALQGGGQGGAPAVNGGMANGGGGFQGTCRDSPETVLGVGEFCTIFAFDETEL